MQKSGLEMCQSTIYLQSTSSSGDATIQARVDCTTRPVPAPPLIAEALATLFGDRDRILELDEAALRMRHRGLDGDDHAGLHRAVRPKIIICTARYAIDIDGLGATLIRPRPLDSSTLLSFLGEQLTAARADHLFSSLSDQSVLVQRLARQIT